MKAHYQTKDSKDFIQAGVIGEDIQWSSLATKSHKALVLSQGNQSRDNYFSTQDI